MILLRVPGTLAYRGLAVSAVTNACRLAEGRDGDTSPGDLETCAVSAFAEAFNNVAIHAYEAGPPGDVSIAIRWAAGELVIEMTDMGTSFDPSSVALPDLDSLPEGGLGFFIMRSFMDDVTYTAGPPNVLRLVKKISSGELLPDFGGSLDRDSAAPMSGPVGTHTSGWQMRAVAAPQNPVRVSVGKRKR